MSSWNCCHLKWFALARSGQVPPVPACTHTLPPNQASTRTHARTHTHTQTHTHTHTNTPSPRDSGKAKLTPMNKHVLTGYPSCLLPLQQLCSCKPLLLFLLYCCCCVLFLYRECKVGEIPKYDLQESVREGRAVP